MLKDGHMVCVKFDSDRTDDSLVTRLNNAEVAAKLVDRVDRLSKIIHANLF